ncbi:MAG: glycoside hydrolase family 2 protein [Armatimonadota bacterium]
MALQQRASIPRPEHPRPDLHRGLRPGVDWLNLNGDWEFEFDPDDIGIAEGWQSGDPGRFSRTIRVPFPWESHLAWGTEDRAGNDDWFSTEAYLAPDAVTRDNYREAARHTVGWYRREFEVPDGWQSRRVYLNVGAADWDLRAWVNGVEVGAEESGYLPVALDITESLRDGGNTLVIRVHDPEDHSRQPIGKQVSNWYTRTSGIWQTVWLEPRAEAHIRSVRVEPSLSGGRATVHVGVHGPDGAQGLCVGSDLRASAGPRVAGGEAVPVGDDLSAELRHEITGPIPWTPDAPHLYRAEVRLMRDGETIDTVHTQFGMRDIDTGPLYEDGPTYIRLNGEPIYLRGALDQSFHPAGVYTHATDAEIRRDLQLARQAGLNFLRLHIKTPDPRYCYWADQCGVLLMCDMPGLGYDGYSEVGKRRWERTAWGQIARDFNHPSIFSWCLFNETWGLGGRAYADDQGRQAWVRECYETAKRLDPTRLVEDNSPCLQDHVVSDINSWHFYINDYEQAREHLEEVVARTYRGSRFNYVGGNAQGDEPLLNSEYGGIGARMGDLDVSWCLRFLTNELRKHEKVCGYVYTELTDIEWEHNGIFNYDRSPKEFGYDPALLLGETFVGFDAPPARTVLPGASVRVPVFLRPSPEAEELERRLSWTATFIDRLGREEIVARRRSLQHGRRGERFIEVDLPRRAGLVRLEAVVGDEQGRPAALNFCFFEVVSSTGGTSDPAATILTLPAGACHARFDAEPEIGEVAGEAHLIAGIGDGTISYTFELPDDLDADDVDRIALLAEISSARPGAPQTSDDRWPSVVRIEIGGYEAATVHLSDQPADSRGALSHMNGLRGRYGELATAAISGDDAREAAARGRVEVRISSSEAASGCGGVTVYGSRAGRYPCEVTLILSPA